MTDESRDEEFEQLLEHLKHARGIDFTGYKRSSLERRITKRVEELGLDGYLALQDHLEVHPDEFARLIDTIFINVTSFFRDPPSWDHVVSEVVPDLLDRAGDRQLRLWSAGCSSGEEAYTLVMVLAEAMGPDAVRDRVKIYATDIDDGALAQARQATYESAALEPIPAELRDRYFEPVGTRWQFRADLRRSVIFGRHDLIHDAPISRLDLLVCRNVLMYFNRETQSGVLERLHFALRPEGYLFLGRAEMLLTRSNLFRPVDLRHRLFHPVPTTLRPAAAHREEAPGDHVARSLQLRDAALEAASTAQLVVDDKRMVVAINERCRTMFGLLSHDVGRPLRDLEISYRPVDLRGHIDQVITERHPVTLRSVTRRPVGSEDAQYLDIVVTPLYEGDAVIGVSTAFTDVTQAELLRDRVQRAHQDLETSNEELQSTNEELETTNEELQSSNEELETMNEELQSINAEQAEVAAELNSRSEQLNRTTTFLRGIVSSISAAVIVVDTDMTVQIWNDRAFDLWGLHDEEVLGRPLATLDIGLPVDALVESLRKAFEGHTQRLELTGITRRGHAAAFSATVTPLHDDTTIVKGAVLVVYATERNG